MSEIAIQVDGLGKRYRIGAAAERSDSLRDALVSLARAPFRNFRRLHGLTSFREEEQDVVWAVRDISFEVKHGEVLGIIGRNGAGKSTLLKVLSRITEPTTGRATVHGRIGALLEVGTGFHQELTGRENVYLNGSILGMDRAYIDRKFDEIVDFAGVEKFIDTPVKRYSSGMYLRLAFAVAAHLEPEVLIVDEVLAVGDAEFQKKCLGKMGDVAKEGRTVLFVSHNMPAVSQLTHRCVLVDRGQVQFDGPTADAVRKYIANPVNDLSQAGYYEAMPGNPSNHIAWARVYTSDEHGVHRWGEPISFEFGLRITEPQDTMCFSFSVNNDFEQAVCSFWLFDSDVPYRRRSGLFRLRCEVPKLRLFMGSYTLTTWLTERRGSTIFESLSTICPFEVSMHGLHRDEYGFAPGDAVYLDDAMWTPVQQEDSK